MTSPDPGSAHRAGELSRRTLVASSIAAAALASSPLRAAMPNRIKAIGFDGFVIFDPRSIAALAEQMFPGKGAALFGQWSAKLFGYTWLATAAGQYQDFQTLADRSLAFVATGMALALDNAARARLVDAFATLEPWPDVKPALERLRAAGVRLAFLSNLSEALLVANCNRAGITEYFERPLSTDRVRAFKPSPAAYRMGIDAFGLPVEQIGFAAFGGWDAVGAHWFGYRTAWINRLGVPTETIDIAPEIVSPGMDGVLKLAGIA